MRLSNADLACLLTSAGRSSAPAASRMQRPRANRCGREVARANELGCMRTVAAYGHVRIAELSRAVWPSARYGEQVCRRTVRRLVAQGLLLERRNALGSTSLCLTRAGAAWLELRGIPARHTMDLSSVSGPTFFHRTLATRYLIERQVAGSQVAGEYHILRRELPFSIDKVARALRKLPDGLVWQRDARDDSVAVELVEQEAAPKARAEIEKALRAATLVGTALSTDGRVRLGGIVFVYDRSLNHERRLLLAADSLWGGRSLGERTMLERSVKMVAVDLREPLVWVGSTSRTMHEVRSRSA